MLVAALVGLLACWLLRITYVVLHGRSSQPAGDPPVHTMAVLGSGGHTAEMIALLESLDDAIYSPREYVIADTDHTSADRIAAFEQSRPAPSFPRLLSLPRSREVGQSYISSVATTMYALVHAVVLVFRSRPSLLLCNGPGTCIPVCAAALGLRLLGVKYVTIVYVESIARVQTLSLSGRILLPIADHFLVQWPALAEKFPRAKCIGRLA